jgi:hypothetical protein
MGASEQQSLAWTQFVTLRTNPRRALNKEAVSIFHRTVTALEDAYGFVSFPSSKGEDEIADY